jgi:hypothetical protein
MAGSSGVFFIGPLIKKAVRWYVMVIQKIIIAVSLFFLYGVGFGIMSVFVRITGYKSTAQHTLKNSFWAKAEGYDETLSDCLRES